MFPDGTSHSFDTSATFTAPLVVIGSSHRLFKPKFSSSASRVAIAVADATKEAKIRTSVHSFNAEIVPSTDPNLQRSTS